MSPKVRFSEKLRFEKVTGNGLAVEARFRYDREKQLYETASDAKAPSLPYLFFADANNDGLLDALAVGPSDSTRSPRCEDVGGRFWNNLDGFRFEERTEAAGLVTLILYLSNHYGLVRESENGFLHEVQFEPEEQPN